MSRVKRGVIKNKKRKKLLKRVKGFRKPYSNKKKFAKEAILHAEKRAYEGRKQKKRDFRRLWQVRINAYLRSKGLKYSQFVFLLKEKNISLNRKVLAELANKSPQVFDKIIEYLR